MPLRWRKVFLGSTAAASAVFGAGVAYVAFPLTTPLALPPPLQSTEAAAPQGEYAADFEALQTAFRAQRFRSFCGPASVSTVLRAYGMNVEQTRVFPSAGRRVDAFFTGMSLAELSRLAQDVGLETERVHADGLTIDAFRDRLKANLRRRGDFVLINYDRRVLQQEGAGHISPVGAYDEATDRILVLDEAAYKYPFTWIPTQLLYEAVHTKAGEGWRGLLFIHSYSGKK
jgi:hypothetical protein